MKLYSFFRSGTSHRLRIALNLKGLAPDYIPVDLRVDEQAQAPFKAVNPQGLVPALTLEDGQTLIQSPAIIEWLEERYPAPALLPKDPEARAKVRALAAIVGCDVHPINNRRILQYLGKRLGADEAALNAWCATWITAGFDAIEALLAKDRDRGDFCFGHSPTIADVYLIPQVESARRFKVDMAHWPLISSVDTACSQLPAFAKAAPLEQSDA
ncbi:maleylacetoacetate isomerase [Diaphorobacter ruginosibacter]|uniref:maleylacetoacetate isomerase n=1 Tax=Diaphorobacter ruginosibacter TaxID=1715720 RepID=UPI0033404F28